MEYSSELAGAIDALARIQQAGQLPELERAVAAATSGPREDLDRWPDYLLAVDELARVASRLFGWPIEECRRAAAERILPSTRRRTVMEVIRGFLRQLDIQSRTAADSKFATERGGRKAS